MELILKNVQLISVLVQNLEYDGMKLNINSKKKIENYNKTEHNDD